ncbi:hypothetical protein WA171_005618 [Blastocystis sp. BT1]
MFARFLGKKKQNPDSGETLEDRKLRKMVQTAATIDGKISVFERKAEAVAAKRAKYYEAAKKARSLHRDLETKRFLRGVKQCDEEYQRYSNMSVKLGKLKSMTEAYLDHSDFLTSVGDVTTLVNEFGLKPEDAENLMDKMRDMQETVKDMDDVVAEGIEEDDEGLDDLLADLDKDLSEDPINQLPEVAHHTPTSAASVPDVAVSDLNAELESLSFVCSILHVQ